MQTYLLWYAVSGWRRWVSVNLFSKHRDDVCLAIDESDIRGGAEEGLSEFMKRGRRPKRSAMRDVVVRTEVERPVRVDRFAMSNLPGWLCPRILSPFQISSSTGGATETEKSSAHCPRRQWMTLWTT